jgi:lysophospholipase L1-like esterase
VPATTASLPSANQVDVRDYSTSPTSVAFRKATGRPTSVLFTGDSLTGGYFASRVSQSFPALISNVIGPVTQQTAQRANQTLSTVSGITNVPTGLDLAVVELGTNDWNETPLNTFRNQYDALVERIRAASPDAAIVCLGVWRDNTNGYDAEIQDSCLAANGIFVPIARLYRPTQNRGPAGVRVERGTSDDFHPNDRGHAVIANAVLAAIGQPQVPVPADASSSAAPAA